MLSLPKDLLAKLTEMAKKKGLSRAAYIRMVLTEQCVALASRRQV